MIIFSSLSDVYKIYKEKVMYDYVVEKKHDIMSSLKCHSGCSILSDDKPSEWQIFDCVPASVSLFHDIRGLKVARCSRSSEGFPSQHRARAAV